MCKRFGEEPSRFHEAMVSSPCCAGHNFVLTHFLIKSFQVFTESCTPKCNEHAAPIFMISGAVVVVLLPISSDLPPQKVQLCSRAFLDQMLCELALLSLLLKFKRCAKGLEKNRQDFMKLWWVLHVVQAIISFSLISWWNPSKFSQNLVLLNVTNTPHQFSWLPVQWSLFYCLFLLTYLPKRFNFVLGHSWTKCHASWLSLHRY